MPACSIPTVTRLNHEMGGTGSFSSLSELFQQLCLKRAPNLPIKVILCLCRAPCTACTMPNSRKKTIIFELRGLCERSAVLKVSNSWRRKNPQIYILWHISGRGWTQSMFYWTTIKPVFWLTLVIFHGNIYIYSFPMAIEAVKIFRREKALKDPVWPGG